MTRLARSSRSGRRRDRAPLDAPSASASRWRSTSPGSRPDEMIYGLVGESLWETGTLSIRGIATPYYSLLDARARRSPADAGRPRDGRRRSHSRCRRSRCRSSRDARLPLGEAARRAAAGRSSRRRSRSLPPALWYGGLLMTEALFYTRVVGRAARARADARAPTLERQGAVPARPQPRRGGAPAGAPPPPGAPPRSRALRVVRALDARSLRRLAAAARADRASPGSSLVVLCATGSDTARRLRGGRGARRRRPSGLLAQLDLARGALVVMTLGLPLLATATLVVLGGAVRGRSDPRVRAFLAVTTAYVVLLVGQVSALRRRLPRPRERALPDHRAAAAPARARRLDRARRAAAAPDRRAARGRGRRRGRRALRPRASPPALAAHDALTASCPSSSSRRAERARCASLLVPRALAVAAAFLLLAAALAARGRRRARGRASSDISRASAREIDELSAIEQRARLRRRPSRPGSTTPAPADAARSTRASSRRRRSHGSTFWNRSVRQLARLAACPQQALPQVPVDDPPRRRARGRERGDEVSAPYAVVPATNVLAGERVATSPPTEVAPGLGALARRRAAAPRLARRRASRRSATSGAATVVVYRCGPGALELTLLGKDGSRSACA